nr:two-pore potassium channel 1-like isoform X2 [Quercus suber]
MASNGVEEPLLSGMVDPSVQTKKKNSLKRRRYRHCKSAPLAKFVPPETKGIGQIPRTESIRGKLHPSFKQVAIFLAVYLGVGAVTFLLVRNQIEGYGDLVPDSTLTKLLACAFVFTGMALIGLILSKAADYLVEKQETLLVKALHMSHNVGTTEILKEVETNKVRYKCLTVFILLLVLVIIGTIFLATVEKLDLVDAFYCVCATITTLGYGDKSFSTEVGRAFAVIWILTSTITLAQFFLYIAELNTERRQRALANWVRTRKMTSVDLEAADIDDDGVVDASDFIIYKLKEMGKISQDDISLLLEEFEDLDVDQSGTLSVSDIMLAQS